LWGNFFTDACFSLEVSRVGEEEAAAGERIRERACDEADWKNKQAK
jgi:hypothetical protein